MGLFQLLVLLSIQIIAAKSNFTKTGYFPVPVCPNNTHEWQASSRQLNCNDTYKYHCAPYYDLSQLYEFCYQRPLLEVKKGHCIGIAESGILNQLNCEYFAHGCPREDYNSSQLYNYPNCLSILNGCYTEDCVCKCQSARKENDTKTSKSDIATVPNFLNISGQRTEPASCENQYLIAFVIICLICFIASVALNVVQYRKQSGQGFMCYTNPSLDEGLGLLNGQNHETQSQQRHTRGTQTISCDEQDNVYKLTSVDYTIEDGQLFQLLKRQCLHGVLSGFKYLVDTRVYPKKKEYIFKQRDENGCILLHYAACGGNILILNEILKIASDKVLEYKCIRGQDALHFAIRYKQKDMTDYLIQKYSLLSTTIEENMHATNSNTSNYDNNMFEKFAIVHWVAWLGDVRLLASLKQNNFDISLKTRNGLNILDLACMKKETDASEGEFEFCLHLLNNEAENIDPSKTDVSGWTIAHYASLSNIRLLEYMAANEKFRYLIMEKTNSLKTCLHIACEFAKHETVKFITKNFETLLQVEDELGWNALHFAAKGGNLDTLRYLLSKKCMQIDCRTKDGKTLLHIACIFKQTSICEFVVSEFSEELLNARTYKYHLTAAHYLGVEKKEDELESEIKIFEILAGSKMKLSAKSSKGLSVLDFAIDHLSRELVTCMVKTKYREKLGLNPTILARCKENTKDDEIKRILQTAIDDI